MPTIGHWLTLTGGLVLLACGALSLMITSCPRRTPTPRTGKAPLRPLEAAVTTVRVRLADGAETLNVSSFSQAEWSAVPDARGEPAEEEALLAGRGPWVVHMAEGGVFIEGGTLPTPALLLRPEGGLFRLGRALYRGSLIVTADAQGGLTAIEVLSIEDYLRGVVTSEMSSRWPAEALKAQAVAARTFAAYRLSPSGHARPFLKQSDLAYGGYGAETWAGDRAVKQTEGLVMEYQGALFPAYFSSACGGATSSAAHVWGEPPLPPLGGVKCEWCRDSPYYEWTVSIKAADLAAALSEFGVQEVTSLQTAGADAAGYAAEVVVNGNVEIPADRFRRAVGPHSLRSAAFEVQKKGDAFEFHGHGWGHGVGLCQWGARGMAAEGRGWREILQQYYPGAEIATLGSP